jgi:hypothetical protein
MIKKHKIPNNLISDFGIRNSDLSLVVVSDFEFRISDFQPKVSTENPKAEKKVFASLKLQKIVHASTSSARTGLTCTRIHVFGRSS